MRGGIRNIIQPVLWKTYRWYLKKKRWYSFKGLKICIYPSVFHPGLLWTTHYLLDFIRQFDLKGKQVLELGAGSGLIALWASQAGGIVTASDINPAAIRSINESAQRNQLSIKTYQSNLFDSMPLLSYDLILINPPFYPKEPKNDQELAFFCGADFEYFQRLFAQIKNFITPKTNIFFVLTDDCELKTIQKLAQLEGGQFELRERKKKWGEELFIFQLKY